MLQRENEHYCETKCEIQNCEAKHKQNIYINHGKVMFKAAYAGVRVRPKERKNKYPLYATAISDLHTVLTANTELA